jgi:signal transduction histidine kinase
MMPHTRTAQLEHKRMSYFRFIYGIGVFTYSLFTLRYNFQYHITRFNDVLIPLWIAYATGPYLLLKISKNFTISSVYLITLSLLCLSFLLYTAGGVEAPGIFWLAASPLLTGILLGLPGVIGGYLFISAIVALFWYLHSLGIGPNIVAEQNIYAQEKLINLLIFIFFSSFIAHHFFERERNYTKQLQEHNLDIDNLLRVLLHDIANTLSSMTYNLMRAKEDHTHASSNELDKIQRAVDDISDLLAQVRHLKSIKDGKASLPLQPISLSFVLSEVYESSEGAALQKGIKLAMDISRDRMQIMGERTILANTVLLNLMTNAIKFSHPGDRVDVRAYTNEEYAFIEIEDYGVGIPPEIMPYLFDVGVQTTRPGTHGEKGTGYGMPLVKEYLQLMEGVIEITSHVKSETSAVHGTKIVLRFPLFKAEAAP